ncbi:MAG TPA: alpha/beta hydrolase family protein [Desulfuromonadaceae bacterium]
MNRMNEFLTAQYEASPRKLNVARYLDDSLTHAQWQGETKDRLRRLLGRFPEGLQPAEYRAEGSEEELPFGTRSKLIIQSEEFLDTPAYVLQPKTADARTPVILCLHGHGSGSADIAGVLQEASYQKSFAASLCRLGFIAVAPELAGFGALRLEEDILGKAADESSCHRLSMGLISCGRTMAGVRVHQCMRVLDVVQQHFPGHPIGVMGISGGGMIAVQLSVLDERISAVVISGYACTFRDSILAMYHCVDNYLPGMLEWFELEDLLSAIAPRPMLWETGSRDPIFPQGAVFQAGISVQRCYEKLGVPNHFRIHAFDGEHEISGVESYDFLKTHLSQVG